MAELTAELPTADQAFMPWDKQWSPWLEMAHFLAFKGTVFYSWAVSLPSMPHSRWGHLQLRDLGGYFETKMLGCEMGEGGLHFQSQLLSEFKHVTND